MILSVASVERLAGSWTWEIGMGGPWGWFDVTGEGGGCGGVVRVKPNSMIISSPKVYNKRETGKFEVSFRTVIVFVSGHCMGLDGNSSMTISSEVLLRHIPLCDALEPNRHVVIVISSPFGFSMTQLGMGEFFFLRADGPFVFRQKRSPCLFRRCCLSWPTTTRFHREDCRECIWPFVAKHL